MTADGERIGERLLLDNDAVRVWEDIVEPGTQQHLHTHRTPYLSVMVTSARAQVLDEHGAVLYDVDRSAGEVSWFGPDRVPVTHTLRNVGSEQIRVVIVEVPGAG